MHQADRAGRAMRTRETATLVVLATVALGYSLQQSLIVPALTTVQTDLNASANAATWLLTGFLVSSSIATPIVGRLGDMYGRKNVMMISLLILVGSTALAAIVGSIGLLVAARVMQGLAGGIVPLSFGIARDEFPASKVAGSIGMISAMLAVGAALGIVLSGPIVTTLGVAWLFWFPLIMLLPTVGAAWRFIPPSRAGEREPIDVPGAVLLTAWLVCILVAVTQATSWGWGSPRTIALLLAGFALFLTWVLVEQRTPIPLIDVRLMRERTVASINTVSFAVGFAMQSMFAFVTRFVQLPEVTGFGLGVAPSRAGLVILPWSTGAFLTGLMSGRLAARFGSRAALVAGSIITALASLLLTVRHESLFWVGLAMAGIGTGTGLVTASMPTMLVAYVPGEQIGAAAGMNQNIRTIGGAIGTQIAATIIASSALPKESLYVTTFLVIAIVCVIGVVAAFASPTRAVVHRSHVVR